MSRQGSRFNIRPVPAYLILNWANSRFISIVIRTWSQNSHRIRSFTSSSLETENVWIQFRMSMLLWSARCNPECPVDYSMTSYIPPITWATAATRICDCCDIIYYGHHKGPHICNITGRRLTIDAPKIIDGHLSPWPWPYPWLLLVFQQILSHYCLLTRHNCVSLTSESFSKY